MFLDRHPDRPDKKSDLKHLGYWHSVLLDPKTMLVVDTGMSFDHYEESFGKEGLPLPSEWVDTSWDAGERAKVLAYVKSAKVFNSWRGWSWCRFGCGAHNEMGSADLSDGVYVWPSGFSHYIEKHGVKPPEAFVQHVLRMTQLFSDL